MTAQGLSWRRSTTASMRGWSTAPMPSATVLPRDEDQAADLGCSRATVQRAMQELAAAGRIDRRRKGGTQVRQSPVRARPWT